MYSDMIGTFANNLTSLSIVNVILFSEHANRPDAA